MAVLPKQRSILYLSARAIVYSAVVVGLLFIGLTAWLSGERAQERTTQRLGELLATVESTVSIACFTEDPTLAMEVARGLMKNSEALAVVIRTDAGELARVQRDGASAADLAQAAKARLLRPIVSPFDSVQQVGEIMLDPDHKAVQRVVFEEVRFTGLLLWCLLVVLVVVIAAVMRRRIVEPVQGLSEQLHQMDAAAGERLAVGKVAPGIELERLVGDVNALADRLVTSLDDERKLRIQRELDEKKYRAIFDNAETGIFIAAADGAIESCNRALGRQLGLPAGSAPEAPGIHLDTLAWQEPERLHALVADCLGGNRTCADDFEYRYGDGSRRWLNVLISPIGEGRVEGLVSDVTERRLAEEAARRQAFTDPLTGNLNRHALERRLASTIGQEHAAFAFLLIDIDGFKRVNDAFGLPFGDRILRAASARIQACLGPADILARIGSDTFAVILPGADGSAAAAAGECLVSAMQRTYDLPSALPIKLGASIGITLFPRDAADIPGLLRNTELALDDARGNGGARFSFFDPAMVEATERRRELETDMQLALARNEFRLYLQPIIDAQTGRLGGAEALIRWQHREKGLISPDVFIPLAEETGLITEIGGWCLEEACAQLARWQREGRDFYLSFNVSGRQIPDGLTPARLIETVRRHGVRPERLSIEITEGVLLADVVPAQTWLDELRDNGFRIFLDDFGTGYSSLSYLKRFAVDKVKIDRAFIRDMAKDEGDRALVGAIIAMARSLRLQVVAEGVEDAEQFAQLRQMGCHYVQGFLFSPAVSADEFDAVAELIAERLATIEASPALGSR
ncbi:putative bifunctional diguanylate cyclase/phosphodiesterase [Rhodocyclus purpureus]|uniref:putative bifunctional diguanylate cyclase/phosphodiesterase n=1 Tax=Rhodocyclus purpureus TaxID=1067 RepID=UPI001912740B|nr:bifunctional diguanylate cyclase/phosphodiesterase [Rhodocyclus purpureus]MBK5915115.1 hypothetical protein [Rhodocyclus purpureus]